MRRYLQVGQSVCVLSRARRANVEQAGSCTANSAKWPERMFSLAEVSCSVSVDRTIVDLDPRSRPNVSINFQLGTLWS